MQNHYSRIYWCNTCSYNFGSVNSALNGLIGSHVHLEKLIEIKNNQQIMILNLN